MDAVGEVLLEQSPGLLELLIQRGEEPDRHHGATIFATFAAAHGDLLLCEVDILDPQGAAL
jgi:hypothetical protein